VTLATALYVSGNHVLQRAKYVDEQRVTACDAEKWHQVLLLMLCVSHASCWLHVTVSTSISTRLTLFVAAEESLVRVLFLGHLVDGGGEAKG
jgi:hypothetical protein